MNQAHRIEKLALPTEFDMIVYRELMNLNPYDGISDS